MREIWIGVVDALENRDALLVVECFDAGEFRVQSQASYRSAGRRLAQR